MAKYTYTVESFWNGEWTPLLTDTRDFCLGWFARDRTEAPATAKRVMRSDGKIVAECAPKEDVSIGMIASWPTPEQYEEAAKRALEKAEVARKAAVKMGLRKS